MKCKTGFFFILLLVFTLPASAETLKQFDSSNQIINITDTNTEKRISIKEISVTSDITTFTEVFEVTAVTDYTFNDYSFWEQLQDIVYDIPLKDFDIRTEKHIGNTSVNSVSWYELQTSTSTKTVQDKQLVTTEVSEQKISNVTGNIYTEYSNKSEWVVIGTHEEISVNNEWALLNPDSTISMLAGTKYTYKLILTKSAEIGSFSILTIPKFMNTELPEMTWWNGSYPDATFMVLTDGYRPAVLESNWSDAAGTNNATHVYFNSKSNTSFKGVSVVLNNLTVLPRCWDSTSNHVDINITGNGTVGIYYSDTIDTNLNNCESTYPVYDTFSGASLNTSDWNSYGTISVSVGQAAIGGVGSEISSKHEIHSDLNYPAIMISNIIEQADVQFIGLHSLLPSNDCSGDTCNPNAGINSLGVYDGYQSSRDDTVYSEIGYAYGSLIKIYWYKGTSFGVSNNGGAYQEKTTNIPNVNSLHPYFADYRSNGGSLLVDYVYGYTQLRDSAIWGLTTSSATVSAPILYSVVTNNFYINTSWINGTGINTDSYNISVNGTWTNGSTFTFINTTLYPHAWQNITLIAYNTTYGKSTDISNNTRIPNNLPIKTSIGAKTVQELHELKIYINSTDADSDTLTNATNATVGSFSGNIFTWTPAITSAGTYAFTFNSSDNYSGIATETVIVTVQDIDYVPGTPVYAQNTLCVMCSNLSWTPGAGNITNSYNVSANGVWVNGTTATRINTSRSGNGWINYSISAYNTSFGNLSTPLIINTNFSNLTLVSPANLSTISYSNIVLTWHENPPNPQFTYQVATDYQFLNVVTSGVSSQNTTTLSSLSQNTQYYYRIKNATSTYSNWYTFTTTATSVSPGRMNVTVYDERTYHPVTSYTAALYNSTSLVTLSTTNGYANFTAGQITSGQYLLIISGNASYSQRSILVDSPGNATVYVPDRLNNTVDTDVFYLLDYTTRFPWDTSYIQLRKNGSVMHSSYFDADVKVSAALIRGDSYGVRIINGNNIQDWGNYISVSSGNIEIVIMDIGSNKSNYMPFEQTISHTNNNITLTWNDNKGILTSLNFSIYKGAERTLVHQVITSIGHGTSEYIVTNTSDMYYVYATATTTSGERVTADIIDYRIGSAGSDTGTIYQPWSYGSYTAPAWVLNAISLILLFIMAGTFGAMHRGEGAIITSIMVLAFYKWNMLTVSSTIAGFLGAMLLFAILYHMENKRRAGAY